MAGGAKGEMKGRTRLRDFLRYLRYLPRRDKIVLRRRSRGLGDNLMISLVAREIKKHYPQKAVIVETEWPELFRGNPNVDLVLVGKVAPWYHKVRYRIEAGTTVHMLDQLVRGLPFPLGDWERRVDLFLEEERYADLERELPADYIAICPQGKRSFSSNRKEWGSEKFQRLVDSMPDQSFVQVGGGRDDLLRGVVDRRGLDVLASAFVLKRARTAVVLEGGLMHVCNAVGTPAVVIYGGLVRPEITSYPTQLAVVCAPPCSPCFTSERSLRPCEHLSCLEAITPELVRDPLQQRRYESGGGGRVEAVFPGPSSLREREEG